MKPNKRMTVGEYLPIWLRDNDINLAPTSAGWYRAISRHFTPLTDMRIKDIEPDDINRLTLTLSEHYADSTVRGIQKALSAMLGSVGVVVKGRKKRVLRARTAGRKGVWTSTDAARFLAVAAKHRLSHGWALALTCGLRRGELAALRWRSVDLDEQVIHVTEQRTIAYGVHGVLTVPPKGTSERSIPLGPAMTEMLRAAPRRGDFVIAQRDGQPYYPTVVSQTWGRLCRRAEVPVIALHDARHTMATLGAAAGVDLKTMQARMGHADAKILTEVYLHVVTETARAGAATIERVMGLVAPE